MLYHLKALRFYFWIISKFWLRYSLDHLLCLFSLNLFDLQCALVDLENGKLCSCFQGQGRISVFFFFWLDNIFIYFYSNACKKGYWIVGNFFNTYYYLAVNPSIRRLEIDSSDFFFMFIIPLMVCHTSLRFFCCLQNIACSYNLLSF